MNENTNLLSEEKISYIKTHIIEPAIIKEITDLTTAHLKWYNISNKSETLSQVLLLLNVIFSVLASYYDELYLSVISTCLGAFSLALKSFSGYCMVESKESRNQLNNYLIKLKIETLPDVDVSKSIEETDLIPKSVHSIQNNDNNV